MTLDAFLRQQIIQFLLPYFEDEARRRTIVRLALLDCPVLNNINWDGSALEFTQHLVEVLDLYGECDDGDLALVTLLKGMATHVGSNKQQRIRQYMREIIRSRSESVVTHPRRETISTWEGRSILGVVVLSILLVVFGVLGFAWLYENVLLVFLPTPIAEVATPIPTLLPPTTLAPLIATATNTASPTSTLTPVPTFTPSVVPSIGGIDAALQQALEQARSFNGNNEDWLALYPQGFVWNFDDIPMVLLPRGCLALGNDLRSILGDRDGGQQCIERPLWVDQTEITNQQYERCIRDGECEPPRNTVYFLDPILPQHPVVYVDWRQALNYCRWRSTQLPTEVIWEYAARGSDSWYFPWGDTADSTWANTCDRRCEFNTSETARDDGYGMTAPVGSYPQGRSWIGALDMAGNVKEWTTSLMYIYPYDPARSEETTQPNLSRVLRGGAWSDNLTLARSASRERGFPSQWTAEIGFRCVRPVD